MSQTAAGAGPRSAAAPGPAGRSSTHPHSVEAADSEPGGGDTVNDDHALTARSRGPSAAGPGTVRDCVGPAGEWGHRCDQQTDTLPLHQMSNVLPH